MSNAHEPPSSERVKWLDSLRAYLLADRAVLARVVIAVAVLAVLNGIAYGIDERAFGIKGPFGMTGWDRTGLMFEGVVVLILCNATLAAFIVWPRLPTGIFAAIGGHLWVLTGIWVGFWYLVRLALETVP